MPQPGSVTACRLYRITENALDSREPSACGDGDDDDGVDDDDDDGQRRRRKERFQLRTRQGQERKAVL